MVVQFGCFIYSITRCKQTLRNVLKSIIVLSVFQCLSVRKVSRCMIYKCCVTVSEIWLALARLLHFERCGRRRRSRHCSSSCCCCFFSSHSCSLDKRFLGTKLVDDFVCTPLSTQSLKIKQWDLMKTQNGFALHYLFTVCFCATNGNCGKRQM